MKKEGYFAARARVMQTPTSQLLEMCLDEDDDDDDQLEDADSIVDEDGVLLEDLGLCPHGCADDEGCDEPGCPGGPAAYDDDVDW